MSGGMDNGHDGPYGYSMTELNAIKPVAPDLRAISVRAPWWWFIVHGFKDIENRPNPWHYRGRILIHASKWWSGRDVRAVSESIIEDLKDAGRWPVDQVFDVAHLKEMGGRLVGEAELTDCVDEPPEDNMWWDGPYGLILKDAKPLLRMPKFTGSLGLMRVPASLLTDSANVR